MPQEFDEAICIRNWDWSETSQTVSLFARRTGLVRALAKGSRRPRAPFSGGVELVTRASVGVIHKAGRDLDLLTEWDLLETFPALRTSLPAYEAALYVADILHHCVTHRDPHPDLYDTLLDSLRRLGRNEPIAPALLRYQWSLLVETGYKPALPVFEPDTAPPHRTANAYRFSPALGRVWPADRPGRSAPTQHPSGTSPHPPHEPRPAAWLVRLETIHVLCGLADNDTAALDNAEPRTVERANRLLAAYLRYLIGNEPRTMHVLFGRLPSAR